MPRFRNVRVSKCPVSKCPGALSTGFAETLLPHQNCFIGSRSQLP
ncbi:hypothetical protein CAEBREN_01883 [Caenorhabditis brenneri]|uniref:Uncharacterized protein n=1 Tax=Caenorhabditis brenneri TaxID=135651 RepID=G0N1N4_CAEBE|nr:hypothetical protein CAEBREN_01883 [Caenorhabditis brenneri]